MEILFRRPDLQALCNSRAALERRWGRKRAALLAQRLHELAALDCLADLDHLPHVVVTSRAQRVRVSVEDGLDVVLMAADGQPALNRAPAREVSLVVIDNVVDQEEERR
jgi:hypothetical protein